jgi:hypothetical protein
MPFKSKAQQRFMFSAESKGELPKGTAERWAEHTPDIKALPEHKMNKTAADIADAVLEKVAAPAWMRPGKAMPMGMNEHLDAIWKSKHPLGGMGGDLDSALLAQESLQKGQHLRGTSSVFDQHLKGNEDIIRSVRAKMREGV